MYKALPLGLLLAATLVSCGGSDKPAATQATAATAPAVEASPAAAASPATPTIDVSTWKPVDLSKTVADTYVTLNLPADAKVEKNPNGGIDILLDDNTLIQVSDMVESMKRVFKPDEDYYLRNSSYVDARKVVSDPNGYVYTRRMKPEANGHTYEPETHFVYYLPGTYDNVYRISHQRTLDGITEAKGSDYPEAQVKAIYEAVKKTAKVKKPAKAK